MVNFILWEEVWLSKNLKAMCIEIEPLEIVTNIGQWDFDGVGVFLGFNIDRFAFWVVVNVAGVAEIIYDSMICRLDFLAV